MRICILRPSRLGKAIGQGYGKDYGTDFPMTPPVRLFVGRSVSLNFLKKREVTLPRPYLSTSLFLSRKQSFPGGTGWGTCTMGTRMFIR